MAKVLVSRQSVDEENNLSWVHVEVEEHDLLEGEIPIDLDEVN
jgi:hypothetical protein